MYAADIAQSELFGFIEVETLIFGAKSAVVIDPAEEQLKTEFDGVARTYIPMHSIIRIDEVEEGGISKIKPRAGTDNVTPFPTPSSYPPPKSGPDKR